jgi:hypothetical protein
VGLVTPILVTYPQLKSDVATDSFKNLQVLICEMNKTESVLLRADNFGHYFKNQYFKKQKKFT